MKKTMLLACIISSISSLQASELAFSLEKLTTKQRLKMCQVVQGVIRKDRARLLFQSGTVLTTVLTALAVVLGIGKLFPQIFEEKTSDLLIKNPGKSSIIWLCNWGLRIFQTAATTVLIHSLGKIAMPRFTPGQWNFTLDEFMLKHTQLNKSFEQLYTQANTLLYENDRELRVKLIESLLAKINLFMQYSYYVDGYVILKINEFDKNNQFNAKSQLAKEYAIFEIVRKNFIEQLASRIDTLKIAAEQDDFQNNVLKLLQLLQQGSRNIDNSIQALNFYEQGKPTI